MATPLSQRLYFDAPRQVTVRSETLPPLGPASLLVRTRVSAISAGTELLFYRGEVPADLSIDATLPGMQGEVRYPLRYGYACVGEVIDCGSHVDRTWIGKRVFAFEPHASHFATTPDAVLAIPDALSLEQAVLLPNMETAINFVMDGRPLVGERVALLGQGIVGLLTAAVLARFPLTDLVTLDAWPLRRQHSLQMGARRSIDPGASMADELADFDLVYELSGNPNALNHAIAMTGFAGRVVIGSWYGQKRAEINLGGRFHRSRIQLISSQVSTIAPRWHGRWDKARRIAVAWEALASLDAQQLISHRFPLSAAADAYALVDTRGDETIQVVFEYDRD